MAPLELTRIPGQRRAYELRGVGTLRAEGWLGNRALAESDASRWRFERTGILRRGLRAVELSTGAEVAVYRSKGRRSGGEIDVGGRTLMWRPASRWRERFAISDGELVLATFDASGWGKPPVAVELGVGAQADALVLLLGCFLAKASADDDAGAVSAVGAGG